MTIANFHSILTVVGIVAFLAMVFWVFGKKQKAEMDRNAMIPLQDDAPLTEKNKQ
jgi:LPXTG-motif cell wall-anchored protein